MISYRSLFPFLTFIIYICTIYKYAHQVSPEKVLIVDLCDLYETDFQRRINVFHSLDLIVPVALYVDILSCFLGEVLELIRLTKMLGCNTWNYLFRQWWKVSLAEVSDQQLHIKTANHSSFYLDNFREKNRARLSYLQTWSINLLGVMGSATMTKKWGKGRQFWGLNWDYDPQWILDEEQRELQGQLMECCRNVIRPNAVSYYIDDC